MAPHHHFQNVDTGEMIDIRPEELEFARLPPLPPGTEIESVDVVIRRAPHRLELHAAGPNPYTARPSVPE